MHIVVLKQVEVREDTSEKRQNWVLIAFFNAKLSLSILLYHQIQEAEIWGTCITITTTMVEVSYYFLLHISNSTEQSREGREFYFTQFSIHLIHHFQIADNTSCCLVKTLHKLLNVFNTWKRVCKSLGEHEVVFFVCKLKQSATQPFLVLSRNVCGEECCVTKRLLKTTV